MSFHKTIEERSRKATANNRKEKAVSEKTSIKVVDSFVSKVFTYSDASKLRQYVFANLLPRVPKRGPVTGPFIFCSFTIKQHSNTGFNLLAVYVHSS